MRDFSFKNPISSCKDLLKILISAIILLGPFQLYFNVPGTGLTSSFVQVLTAAAFIIWIFHKVADKNFSLYWYDIIVLCMLLSFVVGILAASDKAIAVKACLKAWCWASMFFVVSKTGFNEKEVKHFLKLAVITGAVMGTIGIIQFIAGPERMIDVVKTGFASKVFNPDIIKFRLAYGGWNWFDAGYLRSPGTFSNVNIFAAFLGIILPVNFVLLLQNKSKIFYFITFGLSFLCLILTFSRGGYLSFLTSFFIISLIMRNKKLLLKMLPLLILLIIAGIFVELPCNNVKVKTPLKKSLRRSLSINKLASAFNTRISIWNYALKISAGNIITGVGSGADNYKRAFRKTFPGISPIITHNIFLQKLAGEGILGFLSLAGLVAAGLIINIKMIKSWGLLFIGVWVWIAVHGQFTVFWGNEKYLSLFWIISGLNFLCYGKFKDKIEKTGNI